MAIKSVLAAFAAALAIAAAQAAPTSIKVPLSGGEQVPPVQTAATGTADLTWDPATRALSWTIASSGLSGPVTMVHFHGPAAAGKNAAPVIWLTKKGVESDGPIKGDTTLTPEQAQEFTSGQWYVNVHTKEHPAGEIRGQVKP